MARMVTLRKNLARPLERFHCSNPSVTGSQEAPMTHKQD